MPNAVMGNATTDKSAAGPDRCKWRRTRARESDGQASLFIRKAFHAVSNCPPHLGGWSANGETFVVKDAKCFSEKVLPTVYKHNNFSSFVRQLNFYGFRKIKSDVSSVDSPFWEFRHPKFLKGRQNLLSEIKREAHWEIQSESALLHENENLKASVEELRSKLYTMDKSITGLTGLVSDFMKQLQTTSDTDSSSSQYYDEDQSAISRKRSIDDVSCRSSFASAEPAQTFVQSQDSLDGQYDPWHYLPQQADIDCSYIGEDYDDIDSLNELLILCKDDDVITCTQSCPTGITIDFEDFVAFRASLAEGQAVRDESSISNNTSPILSDIKTAAYPVEERSQAWAQSTTTVPVTIHDIPFIMSQLPCCLQNRFLERFAESAGLQYAEAITIRGIISPQGSVDGHVSPDDFRNEKALSQRMSPYGKPTSMEPTMRKECFLLDPL